MRIASLDGPRDALIALLADQQHRVVARWQLVAIGLTASEIQVRVRQGRLQRRHRAVFVVGGRRLTRKGVWMAAVLACGKEAALSHRSAVALWGLRPPTGGLTDVTDPLRSRAGHEGIRLHRVRGLDPADRTEVDNIPVTSVTRTLLDYAEVAKAQQVRLAIEMADRKELYDGRAMSDLVNRSRGRRGRKRLSDVLAQMRGCETPWTRSELEREFEALIREAKVPEPQANVLVAGEWVDFFWPGHGLVVEVDGYQWHKTRSEFERDRLKDTKLQLAGCRVMRTTELRIRRERVEVLEHLQRMLSAAPGAGR